MDGQRTPKHGTQAEVPAAKAAPPERSSESPEPFPQVKDGRVGLDRRTVIHLQRLVGNRAVVKRLERRPLPIQRHTISGAPAAPAPLEEEPVERLWDPALPPVQTVKIGEHRAKGAKKAPAAPVWVKGGAKGKGPGPGVAIGAKRVKLGMVKFTAPDLKGDGTSTVTASLSRGGRPVTWGIAGPAGTTIDPKTGVITGGVDTGGTDFVKVPVFAVDDEVPTAKAQGMFTLWSAPAWQAKIDVTALQKSAPLVKKGYKASFNGIYDATWEPKAKRLLIEVPIQFDFPDDPITAGMSAARKERTRKRLAGFRYQYLSSVQKQWGGRFTFSMAREPKAFWGQLGPVKVKVRVYEPKNKAAAYFTVHYKSRTAGRAQVAFPDVDLFRGDLHPERAFRKETLAGEKAQLERIANPVNVDAKGNLDAASDTAVKFLGDYVKRLRQPPVRLALTGKAPSAKEGLRKARAVQAKLAGYGVQSPHVVTARGVTDPLDTQVHIAPRASSRYINFTDVSAHEFGHMIGLPDEYPEGARKIGDKLRTYDRLVKAFGQDYADMVGKVTPSTASIMHGGDQVRVQHYIHFWDTLILVSNLHATAPATKFADADWKING